MNKIRGFEIVYDTYRKNSTNIEIQLPKRSTQNSAGYDFYSPVDKIIPPQTKMTIWTDTKAYMQPGEVLMLYVRSSLGIKQGLTLANGTGVIDADYYSNIDNDGNIGICLFNNNTHPVEIKQGDRIVQGIFINYLVADNGNMDTIRTGGIGSTDRA
jgi:dUTP pyrophosphatase